MVLVRVVVTLLVCLLPFLAAFSQEQPVDRRPPVATAIVPVVSASLGYSFTNLAAPSYGRIGLNGLEAAFTVDIGPRLGGRVDVGYVRASDVLSSGKHSDVLSYLAGPVFYPVRKKKLAVFTQGLLGAARVTGPVPGSGGAFSTGYVNQFAWAIGAGAEYRVRSIGVRIGADDLHTRYFNSSPAIRGQNSVRINASFVYFFEKHASKKH